MGDDGRIDRLQRHLRKFTMMRRERPRMSEHLETLARRVVRCPICGWRFDGGDDRAIRPEDVLRRECEREGVSQEAVRGTSRQRVLVSIRRRIARRLISHGYGIAEIGALINRCTSATRYLIDHDGPR